MNRKQRLIDPTQDLDRHVSESLGARSQRNIVEDIENVSRTPRTKRLALLENGIPIADIDALNLTGGVSTSVQGRMVTANFTGGGSSTGSGTITVQSNDVDVDTAVTTIDFSTHFTVTSSPSGEANVSLAGSGATIIVQNNDVDVDTAVGTVDFSSEFAVTSSPSGEANVALGTGISATKIGGGGVSSTEFDYLNGVTSAIQTQIDGKVSDTGDTMTGALVVNSAAAAPITAQIAGTNYMIVDASGDLQLLNSSALQFFSDNGTTRKLTLQGNTGYIYFGTISTSNASVKAGTGSPEGVVSSQVGSLWLRTDGGTDTAVYRKESGTSNTGWVAVTAGSGLTHQQVMGRIMAGG